jgi:3-oxoadipate enol-lactonase/4-carboxymuconolactone decarboxylase
MRREIALPTPDHAARGQREGLRSFTSSFRLWRLKAHTLVATGAEDQIVPPANSRVLVAGMPNAELAIIPGLGHRAIWEAPEKVAALVSEFLRDPSTRLTSHLEAPTAP